MLTILDKKHNTILRVNVTLILNKEARNNVKTVFDVKNYHASGFLVKFVQGYALPNNTLFKFSIINNNFHKFRFVFHILFWMVNFSVILHSYIQYSPGVDVWQFISPALIILSFQAACVYSIVRLILPFFRVQKYMIFILGCLAIILVAAAFETLAMNLFSIAIKGKQMTMLFVSWLSMLYEMLPVCILFLGSVLFYDYYRQNERNKLLEKERLQTELLFLKGQLNPHFMFNALNSIYILIRLRKDIAEDTIIRFSTLLRYTLYECSDPAVLLEREINFLDDYINLEKLRHGEMEIIFEKPEKFFSRRIAPFILIPFLENAFKHVSHNDEKKNFIHVKVCLEGNNIHFKCSNSYNKENDVHVAGIGLENIKRRLELIYPATHKLEFDEKDNIFKINLVLYGIENDMHHS